MTTLSLNTALTDCPVPDVAREFHDLVLSDPGLLAAEFDAIIAGGWDGARPAWPRPRRGSNGPGRTPPRRMARAAPAPRSAEPARTPRRRPRGPPPHRRTVGPWKFRSR